MSFDQALTEAQAEQREHAQRELILEWRDIQQHHPQFVSMFEELIHGLTEDGNNKLFSAQTDLDQIKARSMIVSGRTLAQIFGFIASTEGELSQVDEANQLEGVH